MDRDNQADDNAEHLYRYISENHPEQDIYFALKKTSSDWKRLEQDGFNLLEFGSSAFESKLKDCAKSSVVMLMDISHIISKIIPY